MACCVQWRRRLGACFAGSSGRQSRWQRCSLPLPPDTRRVNRRAASQTRAELPVNVLLGDPKKNRGVFLFLWHTSRLASRNMILVSTNGAHTPSVTFRTFLQTLQELVTSLKGHSVYICTAVYRRCQRPPNGLGTNQYSVQARR